jgi:hypothetical protein
MVGVFVTGVAHFDQTCQYGIDNKGILKMALDILAQIY